MNTAAIRQQAIRQLVQKALVQKGAGELGIVISDAEVQRAVAAIPAFRKDNRFDLAVYREVLAKNRLAETSFEDRLRGVRPRAARGGDWPPAASAPAPGTNPARNAS